jgi:hypothetical protein
MVAVEKELPTVAAAPSPSADAIPVRLRAQGGTPRQVLALTLVGTLVLAALASRDLATWLDRQGGGPLIEPLQHAAAQWDGAMERLGLTRPHDALRAAMRRLLDWQWGAPP